MSHHHTLLLLIVPLLAMGCGIPRDPQHTSERVQAGVMRVGLAENPPWVESSENPPAGLEVQLIEQFAARMDTEIEWHAGAQSRLLDSLHHHKLDLVIGGFTDDTPWSSKIGMTQPYAETEEQRHILAVPPGENRWLLELDQFLQSRMIQDQIASELAGRSS